MNLKLDGCCNKTFVQGLGFWILFPSYMYLKKVNIIYVMLVKTRTWHGVNSNTHQSSPKL